MTDLPDDDSPTIESEELLDDGFDLGVSSASLAASTLSEVLGGDDDTEFLATLSRDMRDGLSAIVGYSSLLREELDGVIDEQAADDLARVHQSAESVLEHLGRLEGLVDRERRKRQIAEGLRELAQLGRQLTTLAEVAPRILDVLADVLDFEHAQIWLDCDGTLELFAERGPEQISASLSEPSSEYVLDEEVRRLDEPSVIDEPPPGASEESTAMNWMAVPLIDAECDEYIGMLSLARCESGASDFAQVRLFKEIGAHVGAAVAQVRRYGRMRRQATVDELTGVANRRHFFDEATLTFLRAQRQGAQMTLLMLDIDHFKAINDTHGHLAGDRILQDVAKSLASGLRDTDLLARYGGEEFVVMLSHTPLKPVGMNVAERLRQSVEETSTFVDHKELTCTISIGAAGLDESTTDLTSLLNEADKALYRAKERGRNQVVPAD